MNCMSASRSSGLMEVNSTRERGDRAFRKKNRISLSFTPPEKLGIF